MDPFDDLAVTLSLAMRAAVRGTWLTIKTSIAEVGSQVQSMNGASESEVDKPQR